MAENADVLKKIYDMNEKVISAVIGGKYADADFYAHEIKEMIENVEGRGIRKETQEDILSKVLNNSSENQPKSLHSAIRNTSRDNAQALRGIPSMVKNKDYSDTMCVLVVDDNELNLEIAESILKNEGYRVMLADSARRAITIFANSIENDIQVILTDIAMPGMDGNEMTKEIRSFDHPDAKKVQIIALSAHRSESVIKACFSAGMNGFIKKPFDISQFKRIIAGARTV